MLSPTAFVASWLEKASFLVEVEFKNILERAS